MFEQTNLKYNGAALWLLKINDYNIFFNKQTIQVHYVSVIERGTDSRN